MNKPLAGIKVIDCTTFIAGPSAGRCLAEWGADVIKVESPSGDTSRSKIDPNDPQFHIYNNNKKGIVINTKEAAGQKVLHDLVANADVFLTNFRNDALEHMGLDWDTAHEKYPKLIWAHVSGYGEEGPFAADPGFDTVCYWARTGAMADPAPKGHPIIIPPVGFGDLACGATLAGGIAAALFGRQQTGVGEKVMISLYGLGLYCQGFSLYDVQLLSGWDCFPKERSSATLPLMNSFECKDGKWIYLAIIQYERYYPTLMKLMGREDLIDDPNLNSFVAVRKGYQRQLIEAIDEGFKKYTRDEWVEMLTKADIAHSLVNTVRDTIDDEQARANNFIIDRMLPDGTTKLAVSQTPIKFGDCADIEWKQGPKRGGEDTVELMRGVGYTDEQIRECIEKGIVKSLVEV